MSIFLGKYNILDIPITACDYAFVEEEITNAVKNKKSLLISPIASHTIVKALFDSKLKNDLNKFNYLLPDSQWIKKSLLFLYNVHLKKRVYGPELMKRICALAEDNKFSIYLYGSTKKTLHDLEKNLIKLYPKLIIKDKESSAFRTLSSNEKKELLLRMKKVHANIVFIGLGSPLQEQFVADLVTLDKTNTQIFIPVGAAFDFISKHKKQAPIWMQDSGFEWLFRLIQEPKRLFIRYVFYGALYLLLVIKQRLFD